MTFREPKSRAVSAQYGMYWPERSKGQYAVLGRNRPARGLSKSHVARNISYYYYYYNLQTNYTCFKLFYNHLQNIHIVLKVYLFPLSSSNRGTCISFQSQLVIPNVVRLSLVILLQKRRIISSMTSPPYLFNAVYFACLTACDSVMTSRKNMFYQILIVLEMCGRGAVIDNRRPHSCQIQHFATYARGRQFPTYLPYTRTFLEQLTSVFFCVSS